MKPKVSQKPPAVERPDLWAWKEENAKYIIDKFNREGYETLTFEPRFTGIVFLGDMHLGAPGVDYKQAREHAELIADTPNCFAVLNGDAVDNMIHPKIIDALVNSTSSPTEESELLDRYLDFLGESAILGISGNHEKWSKQLAGLDRLRPLLERRQILYSQDIYRITASIGHVTYRIGMRHKYRYNSSFNPTHTVKQWLRMGDFEFDVGCVGHHHEYAMEDWGYRGLSRILIRNGSYKKADGFARDLGFDPACGTMPMVVFNPHKRQMIGHRHLDIGCDHLRQLNGG